METDQEKEIWEFVKDFLDYEVSTFGRVRSNKVHWKSSRILKPFLLGGGYYCVDLCKEGKRSSFYIHHLVLKAFIGLRPLGYEANHKDGIKVNNKIKNLEWLSRSENLAHAHQIGLRNQNGENNSQAKLKSKDVLRIRELIKQNIRQATIAKMFKISDTLVSRIVHHKSWNHI